VRSWESGFAVASKLTREQAAIVSAYTGFLAGPFQDMHEYAEKKAGRPVQTMEFAYGFAKELRELSKEDFLSIIPGDDDE
jgi:hypothetical protein